MPHIVLLWSFIEEEHFAHAAEIFKETLASFKLFTISLRLVLIAPGVLVTINSFFSTSVLCSAVSKEHEVL